MANPYFHNLPDLWNPDVEEYLASRNFTPVFRYLKRAIDACSKKRAVLAWSPSEDPRKASEAASEGKGTEANGEEVDFESRSKEDDKRRLFWVQLEDPEDAEDVDDSTHRMFFDTKWVTDSETRQRIRVLDKDYGTMTLCLDKPPSGSTIEASVYPYTLLRQRTALRALQVRPHPDHRPLLRLIEKKEFARWPEVRRKAVGEWLVLEDRPGVEEQREFVEMALGTPDFAILEGPPGSGKTTAILELILQLIKDDKRVLLCASTHVAVDNVLERLMDRDEVIAVRIGDRNDVSAEARPFQLEEWKETEKERLVGFLDGLDDPLPSQRLLLEALRNEEDDNTLVNLILESANLVCGTTIGILQYPYLDEMQKTRPMFDVLIVDEASKTTFPEFLVPALLARRWILSGDRMQLSPYVDQNEVSSNLEPLLERDEAKVCLVCLESHNRRRAFVLVNPSGDLLDWYGSQARELGLIVENVDSLGKESPADFGLALLGADLILGDASSIEESEGILPPNSVVVHGNPVLPLLGRRNAHASAKSMDYVPKFDANPKEEWAREISWRLDRIHQLRRYPEQTENLKKALSHLCPAWIGEKRTKDVEETMNLVRRIALPSIIELLQDGITRHPQQQHGCALTDGLDPDVRAERHMLIPYQHRMHPDISRFPREHFYDSKGLKDPSDMAEAREWGYDGYTHRAIWMEVNGRTEHGSLNTQEVEVLIQELKRFLKWARRNPPPRTDVRNRYWEIAVLTPYRRQENELRWRLRSLFGSRQYKTFRDRSGKAIVKVCTVDRFQGQEADIVFLSLVRTWGSPGFMDVPNRLNVAITRSRYQLVLIGSKRFYKKQRRSALLQSLAEELPSDIDYRSAVR